LEAYSWTITVLKASSLKLKLSTWLTICLFVSSTVFILVAFNLTYSSLEEALIVRTKDNLNAVNILKRRLIELNLLDKRQEAAHILSNASIHKVPEPYLLENLLAITEVLEVEVFPPSGESTETFEARLNQDSTRFEFLFYQHERDVRLSFGMESLQNILLERTGLGFTGESYVVNESRKLMSRSLFFPSEYPTHIACNTKGVNYALEGREGVEIYPDYRGVDIMGAYRPYEFNGLKMALVTEIDVEEMMRPIYEIRDKMAVVVVILLIISLVVSIVLSRALSQPIRNLVKVADQLSLGALPSDVRSSGPILEMQMITQSMDSLIHSLKQIVSFADDIGQGKMESTYMMLSPKDELGKAIVRMREQLIRLSGEKAALELDSKRILIEAQEKDRERISRDLHDGMGALLTTLKLKMEKSGVLTTHPDMQDLIERTIAETRSLARNLMPSVLRDFGLNEALSQLVSDIESGASIKVHFFNELEKSEIKLQKEQHLYIYRIVQEALNNALKHSRCTEIQLSITVFDDHLALYIKDNGRGFEASINKESKGLGLKNIEERVRLLNGKLFIESDETGTGIEIDIPIA